MPTLGRKPLVRPFIQMMVAAAFLFIIGVLIVNPLASAVAELNRLGWQKAPVEVWVALMQVVAMGGPMWAGFWIWFKRGEKKVIEALDERGEYWWLPGGPREKADPSQPD